ncbi:hypothetical protein [Kitasatospora sp. NPDC094016]|uniref:hypothetical protein n=1 Tax=Kitasatospora sp. NPDC094016 TaxID=3154986 RepID=UPI0033211860
MFKRFGLTAAIAAAMTVSLSATPAAGRPGPARPLAPTVIDLALSASEAVVTPGPTTTTQTFTVTNVSADNGTSNITFRYTSPIFVNIDTPLPSGPGIVSCAKRYSNPDRLVPEVLECTLSPLSAGASTTLTVTIDAPTGTPPTPKVASWGTASALPVPGGDTVTDPTDAIITPGVNINGAPPAPTVDTSPALYLRPPTGAVYADGTDGILHFVAGNDKNAGTAHQPIRLVFSLPPYVRFKEVAFGSPMTCTTLFNDPTDPTVSEIEDCTITPLLGLPPGAEQAVSVIITASPGAPTGNVWSSAIDDTTGGENNQNLNTDLFAPGIQII